LAQSLKVSFKLDGRLFLLPNVLQRRVSMRLDSQDCRS